MLDRGRLRLGVCCSVVHRVSRTGFARAMRAAVDCVVGLDAVSHDATSTVRAAWCELVDGALETIEGVALTLRGQDLERRGVIIAAYVTASHDFLLLTQFGKSGAR